MSSAKATGRKIENIKWTGQGLPWQQFLEKMANCTGMWKMTNLLV